MGIVENALMPVAGCLYSITRDTSNGWYVLEIGVPAKWVYKENDYIGCEVLEENEDGKLLKVFPKTDKIVLDDLINFVIIIISTNKRIAEKEAEFQLQMEQVKKELEKNASKFYEELENLREKSFNDKEDSNEDKLLEIDENIDQNDSEN